MWVAGKVRPQRGGAAGMGAVIGFLIGRTIFGNPIARKGLAFAALLFGGSFFFLHAAAALTKTYHGPMLVTSGGTVAIMLGLFVRARSRRLATGGILPLAIAALLLAAAWVLATHTPHPTGWAPITSHTQRE